jgi:carboxyl-terminal processing protease
MSLRRVLAAVVAVVLVLAVFVAGVVVGGHAEAVGLNRLKDPLRGWVLGDSGQDLSGQVLDLLEDRYYEPIDRQRLQDASVDALIAKLDDPYTDYLSPEELQALRDRTDRAYYGVGLQVAQRDEDVVVVRVYEDSPADREGVKAGDRIVSVEGEDAQGRTLDEVVSGIRGEEGTEVTIGVRTGDAPPRELTMTRARIRVPAVDSRIVTRDGRKIGYIALAQFSRGATDALRDTVTSLRERGAQALVLDLRGDPGGLLDEAVGIAGAFLPKGSTVVVTEGLHSDRRVFPTDADPVAGDLPLEVLVDRNSASASEIVAGALRDSTRGRLVGERTFGKALVQSTIQLRNGGALKLTTQRYLTPSGYDLAKRGLPPAVRAVDDPATPRVDEALQKALDLAAAG